MQVVVGQWWAHFGRASVTTPREGAPRGGFNPPLRGVNPVGRHLAGDQGESDRLTVLVCGGRDFVRGSALRAALLRLHTHQRITRVVTGGARGADALAATWARDYGVSLAEYPADWRTHRRAAGPIRNAAMLAAESPDLVIAFPGGRGTADMVAKARAAGVAVWEPFA
jgi:hypothetical protein